MVRESPVPEAHASSGHPAAVLLLAHGTPERVEEIPEYLDKVTAGRAIPESVIAEISHRYDAIGHSPLTEISLAQGQALQRELGLPVYVGMRNWKPYIGDAVARMQSDGITRAVAICLAPHNSRTSVGLYRKAAFDAAGDAIVLDFVEDWHIHPQLVAAFAEKLKAALAAATSETGKQPPVIFTAHSVPSRTIEAGDPYDRQARETGAHVARAAGLKDSDWRFAFQSQGMSGGAWIGPTVEETIEALQQQGARSALVQPIGFLCDHVEILYDIDIAFTGFARERGMTLRRTESLNTSPLLVAALAELARSRMPRLEGAARR